MASASPRCASWWGSSDPAPARRVASTPTAPPYQLAATPTAPCQNPGRSRYHPGAPRTSTTGASSKWTELVAAARIPRPAQPASSTWTAVPRTSTTQSCTPSSDDAVTSACATIGAPEQNALVPRTASPDAVRTRWTGDGLRSLAQTPRRPSSSGVDTPASRRMLWASACASNSRPTPSDRRDAAARARNRASVRPAPGWSRRPCAASDARESSARTVGASSSNHDGSPSSLGPRERVEPCRGRRGASRSTRARGVGVSVWGIIVSSGSEGGASPTYPPPATPDDRW